MSEEEKPRGARHGRVEVRLTPMERRLLGETLEDATDMDEWTKERGAALIVEAVERLIGEHLAATLEELEAARSRCSRLAFDLAALEERVMVGLARGLPPAVSGLNGARTLSEAVSILRLVSDDREKIAEVLAVHYNRRCSPPWPKWEFPRAVRSAFSAPEQPPHERREPGRDGLGQGPDASEHPRDDRVDEVGSGELHRPTLG